MAMMETLLAQSAEWVSGKGPEADIALLCFCRLGRNFTDSPFPGRATLDERKATEERVIGVLDALNLFATGKCWSLEELSAIETRFLAERRLIEPEFAQGEGPRSAYIADDQALSIAINEQDHVAIRGISSGIQLHEVWSRLSLMDDTLSGMVEFAFHPRLGYLTASLNRVGTGLTAAVVLHLPGLVMAGEILSVEHEMREARHELRPLFPGHDGAPGDLFLLENAATLGRSEEETIFHLKHFAMDISARERHARERLASEAPLQLEDRVCRALGLARSCRLLAFDEALSVLSSLRLGQSQGISEHFSIRTANEVFLGCQNAHIEMKRGHDCDQQTLNAERADLFRARFS